MPRLHQLMVLLITCNTVTSEIKNVGWWKNAVFYQIYPRSFQDANGDGYGDLKGITNRLEHFKDTGIDAVWLSPIYASPMVDFGYDISDFRKIQPEYGTDADFKELMTKAKKLGIKVVMDLVPNHTSDEHEWFQKSLNQTDKYKDYYIWVNKPVGNAVINNWISVFGGSPWNCTSPRQQCYFHQFHYKQPDLNFRNEEVKREMEDVIKYWLDQGIDGFRVDAVPHLYEVENLLDEPRTYATGVTSAEYAYLNHVHTKDQPETYALVKSWRKVLDDYANNTNSDEKVMMTEAYTTLGNTTRFYDSGSHVPFNFFFITGANRNSTPDQFKSIIDNWLEETAKRNGAAANWVMGNHDRPRTESRYPGRGDQMTMLAMILPGVTVTYYGEEIGMVDKTDITFEETQDPQGCNAGPDKFKEKSRDPNRTPMQWDNSTNAGFNNGTKPWIPVHENYRTLNLAVQKAAKASHYKIYQKLIRLKKTKAALITGKTQALVSADKKSLLVVRSTDTEVVVLIINFSDTQAVTINLLTQLPSLASAGLVEVATLDSPIKEGSAVNLKKLSIAAKQSLVVSAKIKK
ncbi:maltase 1 [Fopius arisanus]|uniref:alpha-glucosidase n=2 Tax=Fopius arisanus TaxID=64838 RepID=A0A9R1TES2_9HYME|nr:PREDICTED: maltase 1-like [Fopius arisanus]